MVYLWAILLVSLNTVWLGLVLFALPGNWLIVISTSLFAWWQWEQGIFSLYTLLAITILAFLGELFEFLGGVGGARKAGAGFRGSLGAILAAITGAVLGTFFIPIPFLGTLLGCCVGAGLGAWGLELSGGRPIRNSWRVVFGAGLGQFLGAMSKIIIGGLIWLIVAIAAFWP